MNKTCLNVSTQKCYINSEKKSIEEYKNKYENDQPKCINGHELVLCEGNYVKPYFRHKNLNNCNKKSEMSEWHLYWQSNFENIEIEFEKINEQQMKNRRADVVLKDNFILEIQHSDIADSEVSCRDKDYKLHNKKVIWIIHGDRDTSLDTLSDNSYIITFSKIWKYKSFEYTYDYILLDIESKIFKIPVKLVKNRMFHARSYCDADQVIHRLQESPETVWDLWEGTNEVKPKLIIKQQGAGNGKTYGIWENISLNFDKSVYIITTKQHPAKEVILNELNEQASRKEYHIIDNMIDINNGSYGKQYKVTYKHKYSERHCTVLIGTIDSFIYSLTENSEYHNNRFIGMVNYIINNGCDKVNKHTGSIRYAGEQINLNPMCELWIDECQDLQSNYRKAIIRLVSDMKIDCIVIGDKLQSLEHIDNFMSCEDDNDNIDIIKEIPKNLNRRIEVKGMHDFINKIIPFEKYNLPKISVNNSDDLEQKDDKSIHIFIQDKADKNQEIDNIMKDFEKEVETHGYNPEDFLFIFPIMKSNKLADELETKINKFWGEKHQDKSYKSYAEVHKHTEGTSINTKTSRNKTRIMSIKSSKGDGRSVVFILNCTEKSLKLLSNQEINLVYESYLHVALTRAKHKIYFGLQTNHDDIHKRFYQMDNNIPYIPDIKSNIRLNMLNMYIDPSIKYDLVHSIGWKLKQDNNDISNSKLVDWKYHCIRRSIYINSGLFEIFNFNKNNDLFNKSQVKVVLDIISKLPIIPLSPKDFYKNLNNLDKNKNLDHIPICNLSLQGYEKYFKKQFKLTQRIQNKYKKDPLSIGTLTPLEASILYYMIDIYQNKKYHEINPCDIYSIIHSFENDDEVSDLLKESSNIRTIVRNLYTDIFQNENITWNINHRIFLYGKTDDMYIYNRYTLLGYNETKVQHIMFITDLNDLNYIDTVVNILLERFLISHPNVNQGDTVNDINNVKRYENKIIDTYVLILKQNRYVLFNHDTCEINEAVKQAFHEAVISHFQQNNDLLFNFINKTKSDRKQWGGYSSPYEYILNASEKNNKKFKFVKISYIRKFLEYLDEEVKINFQKVKQITDDKELFIDNINKYILNMCNLHLNFEKETDVDSELVW